MFLSVSAQCIIHSIRTWKQFMQLWIYENNICAFTILSRIFSALTRLN